MKRCILSGLLLLVGGVTLFVYWVTRPPAIASGIDCAMPFNCGGVAFNSLVQKRFPIGSDVRAMEAALQSQGFHHLKTSSTLCSPDGGGGLPQGTAFIPCPSNDLDWNPQHDLFYEFGAPPPSFFVCGRSVGVIWDEDSKGKITYLQGWYSMDCL